MLNIRQLECFRAIMTTGSMTQAAETLGIAQPSASSLISNLEHAFGFALFERVKGRLVATPEAEALISDVTRALESVELTEHRAHQIKEDRHGDLSIVSYPDIAVDFLPALLSSFLSSRSGVRVSLQARRSEMMSGLLPTHDYDLAITARATEPRNLSIQEFRLPCVLIFPIGEAPLSHSPMRPADIRERDIVTIGATHPTMVQFAERFSQAGIQLPNVIVETQTFESVCGFVRRGTGIGVVDAITADRYVGDLEVRRFTPPVTHVVYLLRPLDRPQSKLLKQFESLVAGQLSKFSDYPDID